jgi:hypothetical protein
MAFKVVKGKTKTIHMPVTASTAIAEGALVTFSSGKLIAATSSTAAAAIEGILVKAIAATDSDYAVDGRLVAVRVPVENNVEVEFDTTSLVATDIGTLADLSDSVTVNRGGSTYDIIRIRKVLSSTKGIGTLMLQG